MSIIASIANLAIFLLNSQHVLCAKQAFYWITSVISIVFLIAFGVSTLLCSGIKDELLTCPSCGKEISIGTRPRVRTPEYVANKDKSFHIVEPIIYG